MPILKELRTASVVVVANNFNPSIITQQWLVSNNVLDEGSDNIHQIFTPGFISVVNNDFQLTVVPSQLNFEINSPNQKFESCISKLNCILKSLCDTPFVAVGVNFQWSITDSIDSISIISRKLFGKEGGVYSEFVDVENARYGTYMSKDFLNARLKLDIKPVAQTSTIKVESLPLEFLLATFNFHKDLSSEERSKELLEVIQNSTHFLSESEKIVNAL